MKKQRSPARNTARGPALALELPDFVKARQATAVPAAPPALDVTGLYDLRELAEMKSRLNLRFVEMDGAVPVYEIFVYEIVYE